MADEISSRSPMNFLELSNEDLTEFFGEMETIIFDCDGTLWKKNIPLPGAVGIFNSLVDMGKQVFMLCDNSTKPHWMIAADARTMKFNVKNEQVINTGFLTAKFLQHVHLFKKVYVLGGEGINKELAKVGITSFRGTPSETDINLESDVGAVVIGHDDNVSHVKLLRAVTYLKNRRCLFLATSPDEHLTVPLGSAFVLPNIGSVLKSIEKASEREAFVIGKPCYYVDAYMQRVYNIVPEKTLIVGDSIPNDIEFGNMCGYATLMVMTGKTTKEMLKRKNNIWKTPDFYIDSLASLLNFFLPQPNQEEINYIQ